MNRASSSNCVPPAPVLMTIPGHSSVIPGYTNIITTVVGGLHPNTTWRMFRFGDGSGSLGWGMMLVTNFFTATNYATFIVTNTSSAVTNIMPPQSFYITASNACGESLPTFVDSFDNYRYWLMADGGVYSNSVGSAPTNVYQSNINNGNSVRQWFSQSATNTSVANPSFGLNPIYATGGLNGLPIFNCPNSQVQAQLNQAFNGQQPIVVLAVVRWLTLTRIAGFVGDAPAGGFEQDTYVGTSNGIPTMRIGGGLALKGGSSISSNTFYQVTAVFNGASSSFSINGVTQVSGTVGTNSWGAASPVFVAGSWPGNDVGRFNGSLAELIIVTNLISGEQITGYETYLKSKWGL
jgi:hypothetical protein